MREISLEVWTKYNVEGKLMCLRDKTNELVDTHNKTIGALIKALKEQGWEETP